MDIINLLQKLISIPSISTQEKQISDFVYDYLLELGIHVGRVGLNVLAYLPGQIGERCIILNSHLDTVSPGELDHWQHGPFSGDLIDGKIYGLGSADDKGSAAAMLTAVQQLHQKPIDNDVYLMLVVEEEIDGKGTKQTLEYLTQQQKLTKYSKVGGIVGEPTLVKEAEIAHRGSIFIDITLRGDSGHGSQPSLVKVNVINQAADLIQQINKLNTQIATSYSDELLSAPTICVSNVQAISGADNKIADTCTITCDIRTTPKFNDNAVQQVQALLPANGQLQIKSRAGTGYTDTSSDIVQLIKKEYPHIKLTVASGASDLCWFSEYKIPTIVIGPGDKSLIHTPLEYCDVDSLQAASLVYINLTTKF